MFVDSPEVVIGADAEEGGWIRAFSHVATLGVSGKLGEYHLTPFHRFSPTLKSLWLDSLVLPCPRLSNFFRSFPLLEDLALAGRDLSVGNDDDPHEPQTVVPSTSPVFTGSLKFVVGGMGNITRQLLDLPNGIHFRKFAVWWIHDEDLRWIMELVITCSDVLEFLNVRFYPCGTFVLILR